MTALIAIVGGAALFAFVGWLGLRRSACSLERGGAGGCSRGSCDACPLQPGAPEGPDGHA
ncbi:MAG: hypothetical protein HYR51_04520 [Candidatus Rokubacteria bacterium]|nr:hypothetical protein [Candidatus Rokubacteria bacterium]